MAADATALGFSTSVAALDEYVGRLPTTGAVVITSASYNGTPPDNAARFVAWLSNGLAADALKGVKFTVFGCGSREWPSTYQRIPNLIDDQLAAHGAERVFARGEGDTSDDFDGQFRTWYGPLWPAVAAALGAPSEPVTSAEAGHRYEVQVVTEVAVSSPFGAEYAARPMRVLANRELHTKDGPNPSPRSTRHIEVSLPEGVSYRAGDYLGVLPRNPAELVQRVASRFNLTPETAGPHREQQHQQDLPAGGRADRPGHPAWQLRRHPGCGPALADPGAGGVHRVPARAGCAARARQRRAGWRGALPHRDPRQAPLGARPAREIPLGRTAVQSLSRVPAAVETALLLDLVVAAGGRGPRQRHGRRARRAGSLR